MLKNVNKFILIFSILILSSCMFFMAKDMSTADPMVKITTLPFTGELKDTMKSISTYVSAATGLSESFITYYWQSFDEIYCPGCEEANIKSPVFVDLYVPAFISSDERKVIMVSIAEAIAKYTEYSLEEIFIHTHISQKDQLFISGDIVTNWSQVGGPDE